MEKKKYVRPELIDLNYSSVRGNCTGGSIDAGICNDGLNAGGSCYTHGTQAGDSCYTHGNSAVTYCDTEGDLPGVACIAGTNFV